MNIGTGRLIDLPDCYYQLESPAQKIIRAVSQINNAGRGASLTEIAGDTGYDEKTVSRLVILQVRAGRLRTYKTGPYVVIHIAV